MRSLSLQGRLLIIVLLAASVACAVFVAVDSWLDDRRLAVLLGLISSLTIAVIFVGSLARKLCQRIESLHSGMLNLIDNDFSISLANDDNDELGEVVALYNKVAENLRRERQYLYQRELLLDTVIQNSSLCLVLTDDDDRIIYSNYHARHLFNQGRPIQGMRFSDLLSTAPEVLRDVVQQGRDGLFSLGEEGDEDAYHISLGRFVLNTHRHNLYLIKQMTKELSRQEVATWKKVIRVISHELNNSLAPISSLAHSGKLMLEKSKLEGLPQVFATIGERAEHLKSFIESYARLSKLPLPEKAAVNWQDFLATLDVGYSYRLVSELPTQAGFFDRTQMEQVLVNLLKNAHESGSSAEEVVLSVGQDQNQSVIEVADRGAGMSKKVLENALLPFYTTKRGGSGVGLPLCREVVEAHGGEMSFSNRQGGGTRVRIILPQEEKA